MPADAISTLRNAETGADLGTIAEKIESACATVDDICSDIKLGAGILEVFAIGCGAPHRTVTEIEISRQWLQVEYIARQLLQHAEELGEVLEVVEYGAMAVNRVAGGSSPSPAEDGNAA